MNRLWFNANSERQVIDEEGTTFTDEVRTNENTLITPTSTITPGGIVSEDSEVIAESLGGQGPYRPMDRSAGQSEVRTPVGKENLSTIIKTSQDFSKLIKNVQSKGIQVPEGKLLTLLNKYDSASKSGRKIGPTTINTPQGRWKFSIVGMWEVRLTFWF